MIINKRMFSAAVCLCLLCWLPLHAITRTVAKSGYTYTTVQAAVNASKPGDIIKIMDNETYAEQVTIDSAHNNITLTSVNPTSLSKPKIVYNDKIHVGPKTCADAQVDSLINFDQNGALRLMWVHGVIVDGIAIDGGGVFPFASTGPVWPPVGGSKSNCMYALQQGNSALDIFVSGDIIIKNCDITNAFIGIQVKDRNEGGIFANSNPGDNEPWNVVPLSGFAMTGNHVIEYNRIHDNSYGIWSESVWDLGSTIRYNLIFNNHDPDAMAKTIHDMTGNEGPMMCGGAFLFKDDMYTPFAIYNNTFWHNFLVFEGDWRPGAQHMIFNNIYGSPYHYWSVDPVFTNSESNDLSPKFTNRMNNCIYSVQRKGAPFDQYYTAIMNGITVGVNAANLAVQGNLMNVTQGFPAAANIRWIEMDTARFISVDPLNPQFLEPKWTDSLVAAYIKDAGWQMPGITDPDASPVDIGAIPSGGGRPLDLVTIKPTMPIFFTGLQATLNFDVTQRIGRMTAPSMTLFRYVRNLPNQANSYGGNCVVIPATDIIDMAAQKSPIQTGPNSFTVNIPSSDTSTYAFFELFAKGTGSDGKSFTSAAGFLPFRKLQYSFKVNVYALSDITYSRPLTQVTVGDSVVLRIIPWNLGTNQAFTQKLDTASVSLLSHYTLYNAGTTTPVSYPTGMTGATNRVVMFTKVPTPNGIEYVSASGKWVNGTQILPFLGASNGIRIVAGPATTIAFQDPPSIKAKQNPPTLPQGSQYPGTLIAFDKYGNQTGTAASVTLSSITPATGNFVGTSPVVITTDSTGTGRFSVTAVPGAAQGSIVKLQALLSSTGYLDTAYMTVGPPIGKLFIFYGDTLGYISTARLEGQVGDRLKVTIISTKSANPTVDSVVVIPNTTFSVTGSPGLVFYDSPTGGTQPSTFTLVNGRVTVWVSSSDTISNGAITLTGATTVDNGSPRDNIYFTRPAVTIDSAFYYSRTGFGMVDSIDIYYKVKLSMIPDSITLFWPGADSGKRVVAGTSAQMKLAADSVHLTIVLTAPFAPEITVATTTSKQGISYNRPNNSPGVPESASPFAIKDRVGPLLMSAQVVERLTPGVDTLYVSFSEPVNPASVSGVALLLDKNGTPYDLTIASATALATGGVRYKLVVSGAAAPQLGDSLRIKSPETILDMQGNYAHLLNRPVVITQKSVPATIVSAYYKDVNGDGVVDNVVIHFIKKVAPGDLVISLDWGGLCRADSLTAARITAIDSSTVDISVRGAFATLSADSIKTSGAMNAAVSSVGMPDEPAVTGIVADSAAPVLISAKYFPGSMLDEKTTAPDTIFVQFSEDLSSLGLSTSPFSLLNVSSQTPYTLILSSGDLLQFTNKNSGRIVVNSVSGVQFPMKGDSIWINPAAGVADVNSAVQANPLNHRVVLDVQPISPRKIVSVSQNPFTIGTPISVNGVSGQGLVISVKPLTNMLDYIKNLSASGKIYDGLGNLIVDETDFKRNPLDNSLYLVWDGRNRNDRYVGTGTYVAVFSVKDEYGNVSNYKKKIGVKR